MKLSTRTLRAVAEIITGNPPQDGSEAFSPYRTLGQITELFRDFGERDMHPRSGAPSRFPYTVEKLEKFNGSKSMGRIVCRALDDIWNELGRNPEHAGAYLNSFLRRDGYEVAIEERYLRMNGDRAETDPYFVIRPIRSSVIEAPSLVKLTEASITEHVAKARSKSEAGDHAGAIASAYTLVEGFLKEMLRRLNVTFNDDEGDIRKLYQLAAEPLNLNPKGENLESFLKSILQGLKSQVTGLYEIANKASDRHARRYNPACHHAKLAVNAAFSLCEFLLDSHDYQQQRQERKAAS